ncbi:hypothetical protein LEMLEM_LOCUS24583 [Lemmus lemmus]
MEREAQLLVSPKDSTQREQNPVSRRLREDSNAGEISESFWTSDQTDAAGGSQSPEYP